MPLTKTQLLDVIPADNDLYANVRAKVAACQVDESDELSQGDINAIHSDIDVLEDQANLQDIDLFQKIHGAVISGIQNPLAGLLQFIQQQNPVNRQIQELTQQSVQKLQEDLSALLNANITVMARFDIRGIPSQPQPQPQSHDLFGRLSSLFKRATQQDDDANDNANNNISQRPSL